MNTYNLLGAVEEREDRHAEARAWFQRSKELAEQRGDRNALANALQNLGITFQHEAAAAREAGRDQEAQRLFHHPSS